MCCIVPIPALVITWPVFPGDKVTHLISAVRHVVQALGQIIPVLKTVSCPRGAVPPPTGAVTQSLARAASDTLALTWPPLLPSTGSKNPKIALKLAEIQTDHQGKVRAQHVGKLAQGMSGAVCS